MVTIGSPKQIAWATKIRAERINSWKRSDPEAFKNVEVSLNNQKSAAWWITHREKSLRDVVRFIPGDIAAEGSAKAAVKVTAAPQSISSPPVVSHIFNNDQVYRFEGESRSLLTGEIVHDPACPF